MDQKTTSHAMNLLRDDDGTYSNSSNSSNSLQVLVLCTERTHGPFTLICQFDPPASNKSLAILQDTTGDNQYQFSYVETESLAMSKRVITSNLNRFES